MLFETIEGVDVGKSAGAWLRTMREAAGLSQREVAVRIGLSYHTFVGHIEAGMGRIEPRALARWADALRVDRAEFVARLNGFDDVPHRIEAELVEA